MPGVFPDYPAPVVRNAGSDREMVLKAEGGRKMTGESKFVEVRLGRIGKILAVYSRATESCNILSQGNALFESGIWPVESALCVTRQRESTLALHVDVGAE